MATTSKERMIRKQVYIEPEQQRKLRELARSWGCTEAEVIRTAIDRLPDSHRSLDALVAERLRRAGVLAEPPEDEDLPPEKLDEEAEERDLAWFDSLPPLGLSQAVLDEREGR